MSIKSEILGIAAEHGYEGTAQTITGAINALTDTLAGSDVAGGRTVASAIHALGPYIGGGGGVNVGAPGMVGSVWSAPSVGDSYTGSGCITKASLGGTVLVDAFGSPIMSPSYAAGLGLETGPVPYGTCSAYIVKISQQGKYAQVDDWDGAMERHDATLGGEEGFYSWTFTMPELETDETLVFYYHA